MVGKEQHGPARLAVLILIGGLALSAALAARVAPVATGERAAAGADELASAAARGKQIYTAGNSPGGAAITAVLGGSGGAEVLASALPCGGCHGSDGRGGKEGGVRPTDLTWETLTQPVSASAGGRRRPPYSDRSLIRAVTLGIDPAGNPLHVAMPRYRLTHQDASDLLAYLKRLGHEADPGLTAGALQIGVLLPGGARQENAAQATAIRAVLTARFAELERAGGIYGRHLTLSFTELPEPPAERAAKLREILAREPLFTLVGAYLAGAEAEMAAAVAAAAIPLIGPLTSRPRQDFPLNRYVFYLTPGLAEQANALVEFAARQLPPEGGGRRPLVVVRPETAEMAGIAAAVATAARGRGFTTVEIAASATPEAQAEELAGRLGEGGAAALLLLDNGRAVQELLRRLQALGRRPLILLPASLPGDDPFTVVPAALADRLFISLSVLPPDRTPGAAVDYRHLAAAHPLPAHHLAAQMTALAAAEVLIEGLKRAGRDVSREKLIATLERLYRFDAGLGAPVSFGPNRRVGERGAYVAALDFARHTLGPQAPWIELEP